MDKAEFAKFALTLKTFYPRDNLLPNDTAVELWFRMLNDIPYSLAIVFLQKWVSTEKWSPSIADIRSGVTNMAKGEIKDWTEAWAEVRRAIGRYGMHREFEAMKSLSPLARQTVEWLGWKSLCCAPENDASYRANFRDTYTNLANREKETHQLSDNLRLQISETAQGLLLEGKTT